MRTRKLTCPIPVRRMQLQAEYFDKSVKKSVPRWLKQLQHWNNNNLHKITNSATTHLSDLPMNENSDKVEIEMDTLMIPPH